MIKSKSKFHTIGHPRQNDDLNSLCEALLALKSQEECQRFLTDLTTPAELLSFVERWKVARILDRETLSYREIYRKTGVSLTTIGRVARFLEQEPFKGYRLVLDRLSKSRKTSCA